MAAERGRSGGKLGEQEVAVAVGAAKAQAEWALGFCFADMSGLEVGLEEESEVRTKESPDKLRYWWTAVTAAKRVVMGMSSNTTVEQAISTAVAVAVKKATEQLERYEQSIREQQERGWVPLQRCTMNPTLETGLGSSEHKRGPVQENGLREMPACRGERVRMGLVRKVIVAIVRWRKRHRRIVWMGGEGGDSTSTPATSQCLVLVNTLPREGATSPGVRLFSDSSTQLSSGESGARGTSIISG